MLIETIIVSTICLCIVISTISLALLVIKSVDC